MTNVERYQEIVKHIEEAKGKQSEAKGSLKEIKERLQESHSCSSLKEAKTKLKTLQKAKEIAVIEADTLMDEMEEALSNAQFD